MRICIAQRISHSATRNPSAPEANATSMLSVSNWRISLPLPAPSASRIAISLRRPAARASIMFATLALAISRIIPPSTTKKPASSGTSFFSIGITLPPSASAARRPLRSRSGSPYSCSSLPRRGVERGLRAAPRHARAQPRDELEDLAVVALQRLVRQFRHDRRIDRRRDPDIRAIHQRRRAAKILGADPDHRARVTVDAQRPAHDRRIRAEPLPPQAIANHDFGRPALAFEEPPERRPHAQGLEVGWRNHMTPNALRLAANRYSECNRRHVRQRSAEEIGPLRVPAGTSGKTRNLGELPVPPASRPPAPRGE